MKKCRRQVGIVLKSEEKLQLQLNKHRNIVTKIQVELIKAAGQNDDRKALELIRKRKRFDQTVEQLEQQLAKHKSISDTIQETVRRIELKIEEARRKKLLLATQRQAFETSRKLTYGLEGHGGDNLLDAIEDDLTFLQAETRLSLDIDVDRIGVEELERRLEEHSREEQEEIPDEEELAILKDRITSERETLEALPESTLSEERLMIIDDTDSQKAEPSSPSCSEVAEPEHEETFPSQNEDTQARDKDAQTQSQDEDAQVPTEHSENLERGTSPTEEMQPPKENITEEDKELAMLKRELAMKEAQLDAMENNQSVTDDQSLVGTETRKPASTHQRRPLEKPSQQTILIIDDDEEEKHRDANEPDILFIED